MRSSRKKARLWPGNWPKAGVVRLRAEDTKTLEVFKRCNTVSEEELMKLVEAPVDTYMDTRQKKELTQIG